MGVLCRVVSGVRENSPCMSKMSKLCRFCVCWVSFVPVGGLVGGCWVSFVPVEGLVGCCWASFVPVGGWVYGCAVSSGVRCERKFALLAGVAAGARENSPCMSTMAKFCRFCVCWASFVPVDGPTGCGWVSFVPVGGPGGVLLGESCIGGWPDGVLLGESCTSESQAVSR